MSDVAGASHPLDLLTADEISAAVGLLHQSGSFSEGARFPYVALDEPPKETTRAFVPGDPVERQVRLTVVDGPAATVTDAVVSVTQGKVVSLQEIPDARPPVLIEESIRAIRVLKADPEWRAAMARRGVVDLDLVQVDPWPPGMFGIVHEADRRISRCLAYLRTSPDDNGYAHPIEGVIGFVDMGRGEVLEVLDTGVVPIPPEAGRYYPEDVGPLREDLRPLEITQPEGTSSVLEGNVLRWQRWSLRVSMDPLEGLVLHQVGYEDGGQIRPVLYRASVSEMVVPYGDPGPMHGWKNAFDVGEWGLGRMANSLTEGCDCLGVITYLDVAYADEQGRPHALANAICIHEEDYGILWKHVDLVSGRTEVRRSRRLVVSSISTVGNYEYGFYWYFYLDGTIQLEVKLTGVMSMMAVEEGDDPAFATVVAPGLAAPYHQHLFNVRLDVEVDGPTNTVYEVDARAAPKGPDNPNANAFAPAVTMLASELEAQRLIDPGASRTWRVENRHRQNRMGAPTAYKLVPGPTPVLYADAESSVGRRARFATRNLWVTQYSPLERRAAGDYPNQHSGGDGLPRWTTADRPLVDEDIVLWYSFGVTHLPRPEDWPVMPVEYTGFHLVPVGFFDRNPALDVPPSVGAHCHGQ